MEVRPNDLLGRLISYAGSRRHFVRNVAAIAAAGAMTSRIAEARDSGMGGGGTDLLCPTPAANGSSGSGGVRALPAEPPFPAWLVPGSCSNYEMKKAVSLIDVGADELGAATGLAIPLNQSVTSVKMLLEELVFDPYALVVQVGGGDDSAIVCGDLGDSADGDSLAIGLVEQNVSGYTGVAVLTPFGDSTMVAVYLAAGLFQTVAAESATVDTGDASSAETPVPSGDGSSLPWAEGDVVFATTDLNLRAEPAEDAEVIAVIGEGAEMTVIGSAEGIWLPVEDAFGNTGYVDGEYVAQN